MHAAITANGEGGLQQGFLTGCAVLSALAAVASAVYSHESSEVAAQAIVSSERMNRDQRRSEIFSQFQEQYAEIASRFPSRYMHPGYRPKRGSDEYARLEAYWFFCFSEWYATNRVNSGALRDLWDNYYRPLIGDGIETPSLRYVLEERVRSRGAGRGEWRLFFKELSLIAKSNGRPLGADVEATIQD